MGIFLEFTCMKLSLLEQLKLNVQNVNNDVDQRTIERLQNQIKELKNENQILNQKLNKAKSILRRVSNTSNNIDLSLLD